MPPSTHTHSHTPTPTPRLAGSPLPLAAPCYRPANLRAPPCTPFSCPRSAMLKILGEDKVMVEKLRPDLLPQEYSVRADLPQIHFRCGPCDC